MTAGVEVTEARFKWWGRPCLLGMQLVSWISGRPVNTKWLIHHAVKLVSVGRR